MTHGHNIFLEKLIYLKKKTTVFTPCILGSRYILHFYILPFFFSWTNTWQHASCLRTKYFPTVLAPKPIGNLHQTITKIRIVHLSHLCQNLLLLLQTHQKVQEKINTHVKLEQDGFRRCSSK